MRHPEQHENEIFLTNIFEEINYAKIGWSSKRRGKIAYTIEGKPLSYGYPVFIFKEEVAEKLADEKTDTHTVEIYQRMLKEEKA